MKIKVMKRKNLLLCVIAFVFSEALFAADMPKVNPADLLGMLNGKPIQEVYDEMSEIIPAVIYLAPEGTTDVSIEMLNLLSEELKNQMVLSSSFKPVSMNKYLDSVYGGEGRKNVFQFINELNAERYPLKIKGIIKAKLYKCSNEYFLNVSYFPLKGNGMPYTSARIFSSKGDLKKAVGYIISDISDYVNAGSVSKSKCRIAVNPFEISCRTLLEQSSGEFDFIKTSFSYQNGIEMKDTDDYFSSLVSYQALSTGLYSSTPVSYLNEYVKNKVSVSAAAPYCNYVINGKVNLSNKINIISMELVETSTGEVIRKCDFFTKNLCFDEIWSFNNQFLCEITKKLYKQNEFSIINGISDKNKSFYKNGFYIGRNVINNFPVPTGKIIFNTGTHLVSDYKLNPEMSYSRKNADHFIYTNGIETRVFYGREGEFVWNLLEK